MHQLPDQSALGMVFGHIVDRDKTAYEGVHIALSMESSSAATVRTATSDSSGEFEFKDVPSGAFKLTFSSNGFATQVVPGVLNAGQSYEAPAIVLLVNTAASEVQVTASPQEIAQEQVRQEEKQRVLGVVPNFYVAYAPDAPPLTARQKFHIAWRTSVDPVSILASGVFAGAEQAGNMLGGYGQGSSGYAKRFGASLADNTIGTFLGGAVLPVLLKQDPRYFYKGKGTTSSRILYALANAFVCKGDNGRWQANYSGIGGGLAAGAISNLYYPAGSRSGVGLSFETALMGTAGSAVQNLFQEFVVRRLTPKLPNYGSKP